MAECLIFIMGNYYTTRFYTEIAVVKVVRKVVDIQNFYTRRLYYCARATVAKLQWRKGCCTKRVLVKGGPESLRVAASREVTIPGVLFCGSTDRQTPARLGEGGSLKFSVEEISFDGFLPAQHNSSGKHELKG